MIKLNGQAHQKCQQTPGMVKSPSTLHRITGLQISGTDFHYLRLQKMAKFHVWVCSIPKRCFTNRCGILYWSLSEACRRASPQTTTVWLNDNNSPVLAFNDYRCSRPGDKRKHLDRYLSLKRMKELGIGRKWCAGVNLLIYCRYNTVLEELLLSGPAAQDEHYICILHPARNLRAPYSTEFRINHAYQCRGELSPALRASCCGWLVGQ